MKEYQYLHKGNFIDREKKDYVNYLKNYIPDELTYKSKYVNYDFNDSIRLEFNDCSLSYKIIISDLETNEIYFNGMMKPDEGSIYVYEKRYLLPLKIEIFIMEDDLPISPAVKIIKFNPNEKDILLGVCLSAEHNGLGDTLGWLQAVIAFKMKYPLANVYTCVSYPDVEELLKYSNINEYATVLPLEELEKRKFYATFEAGVFFENKYLTNNKFDYHTLTLIQNFSEVLNVNDYINTEKSLLKFNFEKEEKDKHYVCIASHASGFGKEWVNKDGWKNVVDYLKENNYDVYDIDLEKDKSHCNNYIITTIPENAIDKTGDIPLVERAKDICNADFFIGVSSGLSWLAWCCNVPVVLISGFTPEWFEFKTPYRVIDYSVCNSCNSDNTIYWDMGKTICPRYNNNICDINFLTCSNSITSAMVISKINKIPEFIEYKNKNEEI